jgi:hypothetical protein
MPMAKHENRTRSASRGRRRHLAIVGGVVVVVAIGLAAFLAYRAGAGADPPGTRMPDQGNRHIATLTSPHEAYNSDPPTSGPHVSYIAPWGIHSRPIPAELQVHNLEDGGVMVQYNCECPEIVQKLTDIVRRYDKFVILAPYPTMKSRIALTAWTRIETLDSVDEKRIVRFIEAYRGIDHHPAR